MRNEDLRKKAEKRAVEHVNNLVRMAGGNIWGWRKAERAVKKLTERMYNNPEVYGIK